MSLSMRSVLGGGLAVLAAVAALALLYPSTASAAERAPTNLRASQDGTQVVLRWTPGSHPAYTEQVIVRRQRGTGTGNRDNGDFVAASWVQQTSRAATD